MDGGREEGSGQRRERECVWGVGKGQGADASSMRGIRILEHRQVLTSSPLAHAFSAMINATTNRVMVAKEISDMGQEREREREEGRWVQMQTTRVRFV